MMREQIFAQALLMAGQLEEKHAELLWVLCASSAAALAARLKDGVAPEDCKEVFVEAASLYALAALGTADENASIEEFKAGDLTVKRGNTGRDAASRCLEKQAERMIRPYLKDCFAFMGV